MGKIECGHIRVWLAFSDSIKNTHDPYDLVCTYHSNISASIYTIDSDMQNKIINFLYNEGDEGRINRRIRFFSRANESEKGTNGKNK